ncbi:MAG: PhzF family phenazine biosynthesis protein [Candidatus Dormiibacterota bacterium]
MTHTIHVVDVFTDRPLAGNQLAVVLGAEDIPGEVMQRIAKEMNLAETTFVLPPDDPAHAARVRIFTPAVEMPFAGHPTVGTAWVLYTHGLVPGAALEFTLEEGVGPVRVRGIEGPEGLTFWMTHPPVSFAEVFSDRDRVADAIGVTPGDLLANVPVQVATTGVPFLYVPMKDARAVDVAESNQPKLRELFRGAEAVPAFIFASLGGNRLYSRMFAPHVFDIPEDPATGSGSGPLAAFAVKYGLVPRAPKVVLVSEQGVKMGRRSVIHIELTYDPGSELPSKIEVGGTVRQVLTGTLSDF